MIDIGNIDFTWWQAILAVVVAVVGSARLTRLIVYDDYPPAQGVRNWWDKVTRNGPWSLLAHCGWCMGPWVTAFTVVWFFLGVLVYPPVLIAWWVFFGWLTLSYWVSQYVYFDQGKAD